MRIFSSMRIDRWMMALVCITTAVLSPLPLVEGFPTLLARKHHPRRTTVPSSTTLLPPRRIRPHALRISQSEMDAFDHAFRQKQPPVMGAEYADEFDYESDFDYHDYQLYQQPQQPQQQSYDPYRQEPPHYHTHYDAHYDQPYFEDEIHTTSSGHNDKGTSGPIPWWEEEAASLIGPSPAESPWIHSAQPTSGSPAAAPSTAATHHTFLDDDPTDRDGGIVYSNLTPPTNTVGGMRRGRTSVPLGMGIERGHALSAPIEMSAGCQALSSSPAPPPPAPPQFVRSGPVPSAQRMTSYNGNLQNIDAKDVQNSNPSTVSSGPKGTTTTTTASSTSTNPPKAAMQQRVMMAAAMTINPPREPQFREAIRRRKVTAKRRRPHDATRANNRNMAKGPRTTNTNNKASTKKSSQNRIVQAFGGFMISKSKTLTQSMARRPKVTQRTTVITANQVKSEWIATRRKELRRRQQLYKPLTKMQLQAIIEAEQTARAQAAVASDPSNQLQQQLQQPPITTATTSNESSSAAPSKKVVKVKQSVPLLQKMQQKLQTVQEKSTNTGQTKPPLLQKVKQKMQKVQAKVEKAQQNAQPKQNFSNGRPPSRGQVPFSSTPTARSVTDDDDDEVPSWWYSSKAQTSTTPIRPSRSSSQDTSSSSTSPNRSASTWRKSPPQQLSNPPSLSSSSSNDDEPWWKAPPQPLSNQANPWSTPTPVPVADRYAAAVIPSDNGNSNDNDLYFGELSSRYYNYDESAAARLSTKHTDDQNLASWQSSMAGALVGLVAIAPFTALHHFYLVPSYNALSQFEWDTGAAALQGAVYAATYRYALRNDVSDQTLRSAIFGAFVLVRSLVGVDVPMQCSTSPNSVPPYLLQCGEPLEVMDWSMLSQFGLSAVESSVLFGVVAVTIDFLLKEKAIKKFPT